MAEEVKLVPATDKTLKIISHMVGGESTGFGVTELALALGYNKGTVHSILQTMLYNGWVEKNPYSGRYNLTNKLTLLCDQLDKQDSLRCDFQMVGCEMERKCGELINLHYLKGLTHARLIAKISSTQHLLRVDLPLDATVPVVASSAGKCLICDFEESYLRSIFQQCKNNYTLSTIRSEEVFLRQIKEAKENGYAINEGEYEETIYSFAAPIRNERKQIIAAINIVVPSTRFTPDRKDFLIDLVKSGALRLSKLRGYEEGTN